MFLAEWWSGSDINVYTSDESFQNWGKEHALIVMNHSYEVDWLMGWIVADRANTLGVCVLEYLETCKAKWHSSCY